MLPAAAASEAGESSEAEPKQWAEESEMLHRAEGSCRVGGVILCGFVSDDNKRA